MKEQKEQAERPQFYSYISKPRKNPVLPSAVGKNRIKTEGSNTGAMYACLKCQSTADGDTECSWCHGKGCLTHDDPIIKFVESVVEHKLENCSLPGKIIQSRIQFISQSNQQPEESQTGIEIHEDFICNECGMDPIRGRRYHCSECSDYDCCETCYNNCGHDHPLKQMSVELSRKESKRRVLDRLLQKKLLTKSTAKHSNRMSLY